MAPEIHRDFLSSSYYGKSIRIEARQPEGGEAFVHRVEIDDWPPVRTPDLPNFPTLREALEAGLGFATSMIDN